MLNSYVVRFVVRVTSFSCDRGRGGKKRMVEGTGAVVSLTLSMTVIADVTTATPMVTTRDRSASKFGLGLYVTSRPRDVSPTLGATVSNSIVYRRVFRNLIG